MSGCGRLLIQPTATFFTRWMCWSVYGGPGLVHRLDPIWRNCLDQLMCGGKSLSGSIEATSGRGVVEMIRLLKGNKDSATNSRTRAINQIKAILVTAPALLPAQHSVLLWSTALLQQLRKHCVIWLVECCS